jgi:hypothetical protein
MQDYKKMLLFISRLGLECLKEAVADKYHKILLQFGRDIENIQKTYQRLRHEPPVARDLPPIAGKIMWARQMFRRIQEPMEHLKNYPEILQGDDSKRIVRNYNKVAKVLLEFEVLYHQAWVKQVGLDSVLSTRIRWRNFQKQLLILRLQSCVLGGCYQNGLGRISLCPPSRNEKDFR